jgi:hypothetical protein
MAIKSKISKIVSSQIGPLQAKLRSEIQKKVLEIIKQFANGCPQVEEMKKIIKAKNNLLKIIDSFQKRVDSVKVIPNTLSPIISTAKIALEIIVNIPIPTAIIPPQTGGVGVPISLLNKYSKTIGIITQTIDVLEADAKAVSSIVTSVSGPIRTIRDRLSSLDVNIAECSGGSDIAPLNTESENLPAADYLYKGYTLTIVEDPDSPKIAVRHFATAADREGIVRFRGDSSFSSDTQVLLDEIKFKIDNQFT